MTNPQTRLDQLLAMSNEELNRIAAECQGWRVEMHEYHSLIHGGEISSLGYELSVWAPIAGEPTPIPLADYTPSTDLNQAWELASVECSHFTIGDGHVIEAELEGDGDRLCFYRPFKNGENTPARILTAFGILARELAKPSAITKN